MSATDTVRGTPATPVSPSKSSMKPAAIIALAGFLLVVAFSWQLILHPSYSAPTRDPAWYTWRANVLMHAEPGTLAGDWGPILNNAAGKETGGIFSGGYRVAVPLMGAMMQRVAGMDVYSFSAILMVCIPALTGMALGAASFRMGRGTLAVLLAMLAAGALFLSTPYVGYLDDAMVVFMLCSLLAFVGPSQTSWGARAAIFLIGAMTAFLHPTSAVLIGVSLMGVFGFHFLTSRFKLGEALRSDGPMLLSTGFGMIVGLACWQIGIWGTKAKLADAALPPPYTKAFFVDRLGQWVGSMRPAIIGPLILVAIASAIWTSRRERKPADRFLAVSAWWMLPFIGVLTFLVSAKPVPYYRFMNASGAPIALTGIGAFIAVRWFLSFKGKRRVVGVIGVALVVGSLGWMTLDGLQNNWVTKSNQWADESVRTALSAVQEVVADSGDRPYILVVNKRDKNDETGSNTVYGWVKTYTNVFRTGFPGDVVDRQATYLGTLDNFRAGERTPGETKGYEDASREYWEDIERVRGEHPADPVVFLVSNYYDLRPDEAAPQTLEIGPGVGIVEGEGFYSPSSDVIEKAKAAGSETESFLANHPGPLANPLGLLLVTLGMLLLFVAPGLIAAPFFELENTAVKVMLVPAVSTVLTTLTGIALLSVWRGPLTTQKAWAVVVLTLGVAAALRLAGPKITGALASFGGFFNRMFAVFSNPDYSSLMSVQFIAQSADGVVQASIGKTIAFGGKAGFDITSAPSTRYLLVLVLLLYVPYTLISPFMGVLIDRVDRRKMLSGSNLLRGTVVGLAALGLATLGTKLPSAALIITILVALACTRILLAIKSAGLPAVLKGKDLLQANGLSQAGGSVAQLVGGGVALVGTALAPSWIVALFGAGLYLLAGLLALRVRNLETPRADVSVGEAMRKVIGDITAGVKEVFSTGQAALGLTGFQALRMEFFGFVALVFALEARYLLAGEAGDKTAIAIAGVLGALGGALGMILAQRLKEKFQPQKLLIGAMTLVGAGVIAFGGVQTLAGYSALMFVGALGFFLGKISADTLMQQSLPDGFRGRAFSMFDIAYNLGWIVPALVLALVWGDGSNVRAILIASGVVFLGVVALMARWASRIDPTVKGSSD